jgi:hypothetical protein
VIIFSALRRQSSASKLTKQKAGLLLRSPAQEIEL